MNLSGESVCMKCALIRAYRNTCLSGRRAMHDKVCFAWARNFGAALTSDAKYTFHAPPLPFDFLFLLITSAVLAQFRLRFVSLSAVAEWKETEHTLFTCKHDTWHNLFFSHCLLLRQISILFFYELLDGFYICFQHFRYILSGISLPNFLFYLLLQFLQSALYHPFF